MANPLTPLDDLLLFWRKARGAFFCQFAKNRGCGDAFCCHGLSVCGLCAGAQYNINDLFTFNSFCGLEQPCVALRREDPDVEQ
jgi:hypothetical protein